MLGYGSTFPILTKSDLKIFKEADFQNHIFINNWEKFFQIVVMFSWIILLAKAAVVKKEQNFIFYISQRGITLKTQVYRGNCDHDLYSFKQDNTVYCQISSWYGHWFENKLR